jgi:uncharacterized membrane protein
MSRLAGLRETLEKRLKPIFFTGLLTVVPIAMTVVVVNWIVGTMDELLNRFIPDRYQPDVLLGFPIPGLGLLATLLLVMVVGMLTANFFGRKLFEFSEGLMGRIPLVKGIYSLFKQVANTVLHKDKQSFRKVVLIEYPRRGIWMVGFVTGRTEGEIQELTDRRVINVFVPTTPNPTSGFYILVPEEDAQVLEMTVEDAFKLVISGGMVTPIDTRPLGSRRQPAQVLAMPEAIIEGNLLVKQGRVDG